MDRTLEAAAAIGLLVERLQRHQWRPDPNDGGKICSSGWLCIAKPGYGHGPCCEWLRAITAGRDWLKRYGEGAWTDAADRLPAPGVEVLVRRGESLSIATHDGERWLPKTTWSRATHWMPLPASAGR